METGKCLQVSVTIPSETGGHHDHSEPWASQHPECERSLPAVHKPPNLYFVIANQTDAGMECIFIVLCLSLEYWHDRNVLPYSITWFWVLDWSMHARQMLYQLRYTPVTNSF